MEYKKQVYIYTKSKTIAKKIFIYKNADILLKARQVGLQFYIQKARHFMLRNFSWNFWGWHLNTKSMTLCGTWRFYIKKIRHFTKSNTICVTFFLTKIWTLYVTQSCIEFLKLAEGGWHFYINIPTHFESHFYIQKKHALCVTFSHAKK